MVNLPDLSVYDPWWVDPEAPVQSAAHNAAQIGAAQGDGNPAFDLRIEMLDAAMPLRPGNGGGAGQPLPRAIMDALFGPANGSDAMNSFVILDAARLPNLPVELESLRQERRNFFTGKTGADLEHVAPWLVQIRPDDRLTRRLVTDAKLPFGLWGQRPLFLRSRLGIEDVWRHLRRMTRLRDEQGNWFLLRFWEPAIAGAFWGAHSADIEQIAIRYGSAIDQVLFEQDGRLARIIRPEAVQTRPVTQTMLSQYRPLFRRARIEAFPDRVYRALQDLGPPYAGADLAQLRQLCARLGPMGYLREAAMWNMARAWILSSRGIDQFAAQVPQRDPQVQEFDDLGASRAVMAQAMQTYKRASNGQ